MAIEKVILAKPRGFCAGVEMAIESVDRALAHHGAPLYVFHEIVHNQNVVDNFKQKGVVFVNSIAEVPAGSNVIFSAHGVSPAVRQQAKEKQLHWVIDATCPLVDKVHREVRRFVAQDYWIILVGHRDHDEIVGTSGEAPQRTLVVENVAEATAIMPPNPKKLVVLTQTTLSVDDTKEIIDILKQRFPAIAGPHKEDICYATTNRQAAVKAIAGRCERLIVVGAPNSSNSKRLVEVAERAGCPQAILVQRAADIPWELFAGAATIGLTAGASAPQVLVDEIVGAFRRRFTVDVETVTTATETIAFNVPRELRDASD